MKAPALAASSTLFQRNTGVVVVALLFHLAFLIFTFSQFDGEQGKGLFYIDHPYHIYQVTLGRALLEHGQLVGYDPFFGGGNLGGVTFNISAKLPVLFSLLVPNSVSTEAIYFYYVFLCALIAPTSIAAIGLLLRWPPIQTASVALVGILFWWIGAFRWYHTAGLVSFVCACYISIAYSIWVYQTLITRDDKCAFARVSAAGILGGLGLWLHPLFGILSPLMIVAFLLAHYGELKLRVTLTKGATVGIIALVLNVPWILAMRADTNLLEAQHVYQIDIGFKFLAEAIIGVWGRSMGSLLNPLVVTGGILAIFLVKPQRRRNLVAFLATGTVLIIFAAFGAQAPMLAGLQPNRFLAPGFLTLGIAASYTIPEGLLWFQASQKWAVKMVVLTIALLIAAVLCRELARELIPGTHGRYGKTPPEVTQPPESVSWLVSWIKENTSPEGRILFETSLGRIHGGGHIAGYLALKTKREFIGAPYPFLMPERSFWDKVGFGRPLAEVTPEQLVTGLDLYNVGWIITHSDGLTRLVAGLPQARLLAQQDGIHIFSIDRPLSYFQSGDAHVEKRDFNHLEVAAKPGSTLIMRYHWIKGLTTTPPSQIEPILLAPGFPPFIQISNVPAHFLIQLKR